MNVRSKFGQHTPVIKEENDESQRESSDINHNETNPDYTIGSMSREVRSTMNLKMDLEDKILSQGSLDKGYRDAAKRDHTQQSYL